MGEDAADVEVYCKGSVYFHSYREILGGRIENYKSSLRIEAEGGDSWGISGTGETPQVAKRSGADKEAHRPPPGKRPPEAEIRLYEYLLFVLRMTEYFISDLKMLYAIVDRGKKVRPMRHRYGRILKKDNVVVFPGSMEQLIEKGLDAVEDTEYAEAVAAFKQVYRFDPDNARLLAPYAVALYETKDFEKAKEVAAKLLHSGTTEYLDAMELYLAISIQLQHYEEVEMTIDALLDEDIVPPDMKKKFKYLQDLNERLSSRYSREDEEPRVLVDVFTFEEFMGKTTEIQQEMLAAFEKCELDAATKKLLCHIVEEEELHPMVISYALVLLRDAGYDEGVIVPKFGIAKLVIPVELELPGQDDRSIEVVDNISKLYEKDPSRMQLAIDASQRYAIFAYPFTWEGYSTEEVADAYKQYIESMFTGEPMEVTELNSLIRYVDGLTDEEVH